MTIINLGNYQGKKARVYGVRIARAVSDPVERVTYPETILGQPNLAYGFTKGTGPDDLGSWADCPLITGIKRQTLSRDITEPTDDDWVDVEDKRAAVSGGYDTYDVVTYVPTWWWKCVNDGTVIEYAFSDTQIDSTWKDHAGSLDGVRKGRFRVGCYLCWLNVNSADAIGSIADVGPEASLITMNDEWKRMLTLRGSKFDMIGLHHYNYLLALMIAIFGTTAPFDRLGKPYEDYGGVVRSHTFTNDFGMFGTEDGKSDQFFFWIGNLINSKGTMLGGAYAENNKLYLIDGILDYETTGTEVLEFPQIAEGNVVEVSGTTDSGFFPIETSGKDYSVFWASRTVMNTVTTRVPVFQWGGLGSSGVIKLRALHTYFGYRMCYRG